MSEFRVALRSLVIKKNPCHQGFGARQLGGEKEKRGKDNTMYGEGCAYLSLELKFHLLS